jgi:pimeloyl-ACP methyl ester carboxylesterase
MAQASLTALESVTLPDGRTLSFSAIGPRDGHPVLYMHGAVGSPLRRVPELDDAIGSLGIRYLMVDRPGFRQSDPVPGRAVVDMAQDVEALADRLGLGRFGVVGVSAGAPYALACAQRLPDRASTAVVSPLSPTTPLHATRGTRLRYRLPLRLMVRMPDTVAWAGNRFAALMRRWPELGVKMMEIGACEADRTLLAEPAGRQALSESFLGAMRGGARPMVEDYLVCCRPWGFDPVDVAGPVHVWHGMQDKLVPVMTALHLASALGNSEVSIDLEEGHFFYKRRIVEILGGVVGRRDRVARPGLAEPQQLLAA